MADDTADDNDNGVTKRTYEYTHPDPRAFGPAIWKVTRRSKPNEEIADVLDCMYNRDLYLRGEGLVGYSTSRASRLPREINLTRTKVFFLVGVPGTGISSVAHILAKTHGLVHFSVQSILNDIVKRGPRADKKVLASAARDHKRVPDDMLVVLVIRIMQRHVEKGCERFLIDNFPHGMEQFNMLGPWLGSKYIISLDVRPEVASARSELNLVEARNHVILNEDIMKNFEAHCKEDHVCRVNAEEPVVRMMARLRRFVKYSCGEYDGETPSPSGDAKSKNETPQPQPPPQPQSQPPRDFDPLDFDAKASRKALKSIKVLMPIYLIAWLYPFVEKCFQERGTWNLGLAEFGSNVLHSFCR